MANTDNRFHVRFHGEDIHPDSFSAKELGNILIKIEDAVKSIVDENYPKSDPDKCIVSLVGLKDKSESLAFRAFGQPDVNDAFSDFGKSFKNDSYIDLPYKAYIGVRHLHSLIQKKKCDLHVVYRRKNLGEISFSENLKKPEDYLIRINTSIFGKLQKIGGKKPRLWIELDNGKTVSLKLTKPQADELKNKLYETISLKGTASWNPLNDALSRFNLTEITNYTFGGALTGINELREIASGVWDNFNNDEEILNHLRGK